MATSSLEKALEKQRREAEKHAREEAQRARQGANRITAGQIVAGRPMIGSMQIMDKSSEEILRILLDLAKGDFSKELRGNYDIFSQRYQSSLGVEFEKLLQYGVITGFTNYTVMWELYITPEGATYFEDKERAMDEDKKRTATAAFSIENLYANGGQVFLGDVTNSTFSIDNSITKIEQMIDENGGEDVAELKALLAEVRDLLDDMKETHRIPKNSSLFTRLSNHLAKHAWFYGTVVSLIGAEAMKLIQG